MHQDSYHEASDPIWDTSKLQFPVVNDLLCVLATLYWRSSFPLKIASILPCGSIRKVVLLIPRISLPATDIGPYTPNLLAIE